MVSATCPIDDIQAAAERMFPYDEACRTDVISYAWEHWDRLRQVPLAMALAEAKRFAWRMRRKERSPLSRSTESIDRRCQAGAPATSLQELIGSLPEHLRITAALLAAGHNQAEAARLLDTSKASVNRQCQQIRAHLRS